MNGSNAGDDAKARVIEDNKLAEENTFSDQLESKPIKCQVEPIGNKTMVGLVGQGSAVVGVAPELGKRVFLNCESESGMMERPWT